MFLDPSGEHILISSSAGEVSYAHSAMKSFSSLNKLRGHVVSAVAWNSELGDAKDTSFILIGNSKGIISEGQLSSEPDRKGSHLVYCKQVYDVQKSVTGLSLARCGTLDRWLVFAVTSQHIYPFVSSGIDAMPDGSRPVLAKMFAQFDETPARVHSLPGDGGVSVVSLHGQDPPTQFGWLSGGNRYATNGIKYGQLDTSQADAYYVTTHVKFFELADALDIIVTEFHLLLLLPDNRFQAICTLNEKVVYDDLINSRYGKVQGICRDPSTGIIWLFTDQSIFKYSLDDETGHVWKLFMERNQFSEARRISARNPDQLEVVLRTEANQLFGENKYTAAAELFAISKSRIEDVAMRFLGIEDDGRKALKTFLISRLTSAEPSDRAQVALISLWMIEIYLTELSAARGCGTIPGSSPPAPEPSPTSGASAGGSTKRHFDPHHYRAVREEFKGFLRREEVLDIIRTNLPAVKQLMYAHGDTDSLFYLLELVADNEGRLLLYIQQELYDEALRLLLTQGDPALWYKVSPQLFGAIPEKLVDAWISKAHGLKPKRLLPAFFRADEDSLLSTQALRFLEHCIQKRSVKDPAVHNCLISLYAKLHCEDRLLQYLDDQLALVGYGTPPPYDPKFGLRVCSQFKIPRACVKIYIVMGLFEEAGELALTIELDLAKKVAKLPIESLGSEDMRRKLWLGIGKAVVNTKGDLKQCTDLLTESGGLLKIQDLLPFFPEFATIEDFKAPLCQCLADHSEQIKLLQEDMKEATAAAQGIKERIANSKRRYAIVKLVEKCDRCEKLLMVRDFCAFPCRHAFHGDCLEKEVCELSAGLAEQRLSQDSAEMCPLCHDPLWGLVDQPFFNPAQYLQELKSWD